MGVVLVLNVETYRALLIVLISFVDNLFFSVVRYISSPRKGNRSFVTSRAGILLGLVCSKTGRILIFAAVMLKPNCFRKVVISLSVYSLMWP